MDAKELISYFFEKGLLGKRFLIASAILLIWAYCIIASGDAPDAVTQMVGMVAAFYLGAHNGTGDGEAKTVPTTTAFEVDKLTPSIVVEPNATEATIPNEVS
jgi:hypothetical protein